MATRSELAMAVANARSVAAWGCVDGDVGEALYAMGVAAERERALTLIEDAYRAFAVMGQDAAGLTLIAAQIRSGQ